MPKEMKGMATDANVESIFMDDLHFYHYPGPFRALSLYFSPNVVLLGCFYC